MCFIKESNCFAAVSQRNEGYESGDLLERLESRSVAGNPGFIGPGAPSSVIYL